jgi:hypothetical protein
MKIKIFALIKKMGDYKISDQSRQFKQEIQNFGDLFCLHCQGKKRDKRFVIHSQHNHKDPSAMTKI